MDSATKKRVLTTALTKLKKMYGDDVIIDTESPRDYDVIPSGSMLFDRDTGIGGIPRGRLIEIFGAESSGKTSLVSCLMANAQKKYPDLMVGILDIEQAYDLSYSKSFGLDTSPEKFFFSQPESIEQALTIMETLTETGLFSMIALDSVGGSLTEAQLAKGIDEDTMGSLAKKMSIGTNKLKYVANKTNTALVFINQVYSKMSLYASNATETKGGRSLKYFASMRIELKKRDIIGSDEDKEVIIGQNLEYKFIKNKLARPFIKGETLLYFGKGFDKLREIVELAIQKGFIARGGAWYSFKDEKGNNIKLQGKESVIGYLSNNEDTYKHFEDLVITSISAGSQTLSKEEIEELKNQGQLDNED